MPERADDAAPDALSVAFLNALVNLLGRAPDPAERFGIAVSGGPDSMALLHVAASALPGQVEGVTVDHGLRVEGAAEAQIVADWCVAHGVPHAILRPAVRITGSVQAQARTVRYALLEQWRAERSLDWLLTAHHADDQLETILMRLNRASGVSGLAGIRGRRGRILRPLLASRKSMLEAYVRDHSIPHVADPSNADDRFDRARLRHALAGADWIEPAAAARSAAALADAEAAIEWSVAHLYDAHVRVIEDALILSQTGLPREYLRRLLARMIATLAPDAPEPRGERIDQAISQLSGGTRRSIGACIVSGGEIWTVRRAPPRRTG